MRVFCELKNFFFASTYLREWQIYENFASTYFCKWQVFENFEFINFSPKEKTRGKRQLNQEINGTTRSTERQAGHDGKTIETVEILIKKLN